jgi:hypothetical protein
MLQLFHIYEEFITKMKHILEQTYIVIRLQEWELLNSHSHIEQTTSCIRLSPTILNLCSPVTYASLHVPKT